MIFYLVLAFAGFLYDAQFVDNYDADTLTLDLAIYPGITKREKIRLYGIDTPERGWRAKCESERLAADVARYYVRDLLSGSGAIRVDVKGPDKYGRRLAAVQVDGADLAGLLIQEGHAREYDGGARRGWC